MPTVLIVDDHAILRRGLRGILATYPGWQCCGEADSGEAAIEGVSDCEPDIVIMDVSMPGIGGIKATKILREKVPHTKVVLLTLHKSTELLRAALSAGASGYVLKSDGEEQLVAALEAVMRDEVYVTKDVSPEVVSKIMREVLPRNGSQETSTSAGAKAATSHG
jgi:DNA-binding NarL/FixJ family response regulator